ncbi:MAG: hypothetical protein KIT09_17860 [Bryobacteraceae bacterium]|nr:hypothetical protein [Bryobacteraceae bacterium]
MLNSTLFRALACWSVLTCGTFAGAQTYDIDPFAGKSPVVPDGSPAASVLLHFPKGVAPGPDGAVYVSDTENHRVWRVAADGRVFALAGSGEPGYLNDGGAATSARLFFPIGLAADAAGNVYIADTDNHRIRRVSPDGVIQTVAGSGRQGFGGDGGPATQASLSFPWGVVLDASGNLLIADTGNHRIRRVTPGGTIATVAGAGQPGFLDGPAAQAMLQAPRGVAVGAGETLYIADTGNNRIRQVSAAGAVTTVAGTGAFAFGGDGGAAAQAAVACPSGVWALADGSLLIADTCNQRIRSIQDGVIQTVAGGGSFGFGGDGGPATAASLQIPHAVAADASGRLLIADTENNRIREVAASGAIRTIAGRSRSVLENQPAAEAEFFDPRGAAIDAAGALYVADRNNHRIRKISPDGRVSTVAGDGTRDQLYYPEDVAVDNDGNVLIADTLNHRVRLVRGGTISTIAGTGASGFSGDGGPAAAAQLNAPRGLAVDGEGSIYISDSGNARIRRISRDGAIVTIAGTGIPGFSGNAGQAASSQVGDPRGLALDSSGNLYLADSFVWRIGRITPAGALNWLHLPESVWLYFEIVASDGLRAPWGVAVTPSQDLLLADTFNHIVRIVTSGGLAGVIAGTREAGDSGDGGLAVRAGLRRPSAVVPDATGNIYVVDSGNHRIRRLTPARTSAAGVVNAASYEGGGVAPGEIVTIFGATLGPAALAPLEIDSSGRLSTSVGGTRVTFDGVAAPIVYASAAQVSVIVPYAVAGNSVTRMEIEYGGARTRAVELRVFDSLPGLFTQDGSGAGPGAILNEDGSLNTPENPAARGSIVSLYATGEGQTDPPGDEGEITGAVLREPKLPVFVRIGGMSARIEYAGAAPSAIAGLFQVNARVPEQTLPGAAVPIELLVGDGFSRQGVTIAIR